MWSSLPVLLILVNLIHELRIAAGVPEFSIYTARSRNGRHFIFAFNVECTLLACRKPGPADGLRKCSDFDLNCEPSLDALRFVQWAGHREQRSIDPNLLIWSNGEDIISKFDNAALFESAASNKAEYPSHCEIPELSAENSDKDYFVDRLNFTKYFVKQDRLLSIDRKKAYEYGLLNELMIKDMQRLKQQLMFSREIEAVEEKIILLFDNDPTGVTYRFNVCYMQNYRRGLFVVPTRDFLSNNHDRKEDFFGAHITGDVLRPFVQHKPSFSDIRSRLQTIFYDYEEATPIEPVIQAFHSVVPCAYPLLDADHFYVTLVLDLTAWYSYAEEALQDLFTDTLVTLARLSPRVVQDNLDALLFKCDLQYFSGKLCDVFESALVAFLRELTTALPDDVHWLSDVPTVRLVRVNPPPQFRPLSLAAQNSLLGIATGLPRASTLLIVLTPDVPVNYERRRDSASQAPNICFYEVALRPQEKQAKYDRYTAQLLRSERWSLENLFFADLWEGNHDAEFVKQLPYTVFSELKVLEDISSVMDIDATLYDAMYTEIGATKSGTETRGPTSASTSSFSDPETDDGKSNLMISDMLRNGTSDVRSTLAAMDSSFHPTSASGSSHGVATEKEGVYAGTCAFAAEGTGATFLRPLISALAGYTPVHRRDSYLFLRKENPFIQPTFITKLGSLLTDVRVLRAHLAFTDTGTLSSTELMRRAIKFLVAKDDTRILCIPASSIV